jgi:hypothetical protein
MCSLTELVSDFRRRLESYNRDDGLSLQSFPGGACGDASILLAYHLGNHGFGPYRYVVGRKGQSTHVWLCDSNHIIDITADQFEDFDDPTFIGPASTWHDQLDGEDKHEASISVWGRDFELRYQTAYKALTSDTHADGEETDLNE